MTRYDHNSLIPPWRQALWLSMANMSLPPLDGEDIEVLEDDDDDWEIDFCGRRQQQQQQQQLH